MAVAKKKSAVKKTHPSRDGRGKVKFWYAAGGVKYAKQLSNYTFPPPKGVKVSTTIAGKKTVRTV